MRLTSLPFSGPASVSARAVPVAPAPRPAAAAVAAATFAKVRRVMVNEAMVLLLSNESDPSSDTARPYRARPGRTIGLGARFWRKCNK